MQSLQATLYTLLAPICLHVQILLKMLDYHAAYLGQYRHVMVHGMSIAIQKIKVPRMAGMSQILCSQTHKQQMLCSHIH